MKLLHSQADEVSLATFGKEAGIMLMQRNYSGLADRFGYARAFDRAPSVAIEADFLSAAASPYKVASDAKRSISVKYFVPNDTGLFAVVECIVPVANGATILLELIVTERGEEKHITVEDITGDVSP